MSENIRQSYQAHFAMFWVLCVLTTQKWKNLKCSGGIFKTLQNQESIKPPFPANFCTQLWLPRLPFYSTSPLKWARVVKTKTCFPGLENKILPCIQVSFLVWEVAMKGQMATTLVWSVIFVPWDAAMCLLLSSHHPHGIIEQNNKIRCVGGDQQGSSSPTWLPRIIESNSWSCTGPPQESHNVLENIV